MAFVNMFNDRVEQFNLREENERLAELFSDEKLQEEAQWQAYSVKEISDRKSTRLNSSHWS